MKVSMILFSAALALQSSFALAQEKTEKAPKLAIQTRDGECRISLKEIEKVKQPGENSHLCSVGSGQQELTLQDAASIQSFKFTGEKPAELMNLLNAWIGFLKVKKATHITGQFTIESTSQDGKSAKVKLTKADGTTATYDAQLGAVLLKKSK